MRDTTIVTELNALSQRIAALDQSVQQIVYQTTLNSFRWVALIRLLDDKKLVTTDEINQTSQKILEEQLKAEAEAMAKSGEVKTIITDTTESALNLAATPPEGNA